MRRTLLLAAPTLAVLLLAVLPLIGGQRSLFLRDVAAVHLPMKAYQARALRAGELPLIDPLRAGGQPLAGNPNAVPFYPDNLLFLAAPTVWGLNAHFWLHLLLAPWCGFWLGRSWGLPRQAAWAVGVVFASSGFFLSQMSFYNLVAGSALAPALVAACLDCAGERPRRAAAVALLWALLLVAGEPLVAIQAGILAAAAVLVRDPRRTLSAMPRLVLAVAAGSLIAAPQLVELWRILGVSYRGFHGYHGVWGTVARWDPRQAVELFLPFFFGRPDLLGPGSFWGFRFYTGAPPFFFSLYPGLLVLVLIVLSGRPRRQGGGLWAWGAIGAGLWLSLGGLQPLLGGGGLTLLRYPVKFWLPVALGSALLCGHGLGRLPTTGDGPARRLLLLLAGLYAVAWTFFVIRPPALREALAAVLPPAFASPTFVDNELLRWAGLCLFSLAILAALAIGLRTVAEGRRGAAALLIAGHAAVQLLLLRPLMPTESVAEILRRPAMLDELPIGVSVVHGAYGSVIGPSNLQQGPFPDNHVRWLSRRARDQAYPLAGMLAGRRYELNVSPEGLDSFLTRAARDALEVVGEEQQLRLLGAWGVGRLIVNRPLDSPQLQLLRRFATDGHHAWVYALRNPAPEVALVGTVRWAADPAAALRTLAGEGFDPHTTVVLAGTGAATTGTAGEVVTSAWDGATLRVHLRSTARGVLVIQRAHLPIYRATVDGRAAPIRIANLHRLAVEVPAGAREVVLWPDRRPSYGAALAAVAGLVLAVLAGRPKGSGR